MDTNTTNSVQLSKGNGTSKEIDPKHGSENSTIPSTDQRGLIITENTSGIHHPVTNGSTSTTSSPAKVSVTVTPEMHQTKKTNHSVTTVAITTTHSVLRTTTTPKVTPTKRSTTQKTTTKTTTTTSCTTPEHKKDSIVFRCLIVIAVLASVTLVFIVTTVVLATKLASHRYQYRASLLQDTEMVCISALMNDTDHPIPHPKHPKSNGALIPNTEDEEGDDLTLNSFLPDADGAAQS